MDNRHSSPRQLLLLGSAMLAPVLLTFLLLLPGSTQDESGAAAIAVLDQDGESAD